MDVLGFEPASDGGKRGNLSLDAVVAERLARSGIRGWRIVGVAVPSGDLEAGAAALLEGLVAGDVVIAGEKAPDPAADAAPRALQRALRILVHRGDCLTDVRAVPRGAS